MIKKVIIFVQSLVFINICLTKLAKMLFKLIKVKKSQIKFKNSKYAFYDLIFSLKLIKLKIFKTYIKIN